MVKASWKRQVLLGLEEWVAFEEEEKGEEEYAISRKS